MSIALLDKFNRHLGRDAGSPWPETCTDRQIAKVLELNQPDVRWLQLLRQACERGDLPHTTEVKTVMVDRPRSIHRPDSLTEFLREAMRPPEYTDVTFTNIAASDLARWLAGNEQPPGELLKAWFKARGVGEVVKPETAPFVGKNSEVHGQLHWNIKKPQRYHGYTVALHGFLVDVHRSGKTCPTARDVLVAWRTKKPAEIYEVFTDEFKYLDTKGDAKTVSLDALREAIKRMTSTR